MSGERTKRGGADKELEEARKDVWKSIRRAERNSGLNAAYYGKEKLAEIHRKITPHVNAIAEILAEEKRKEAAMKGTKMRAALGVMRHERTGR